jgi:hypothetical protein
VKLTTATLALSSRAILQQGPGHFRLRIIIKYFQCFATEPDRLALPGFGRLFCPAARFAVLDPLQIGGWLIASREYGLY